MKKYYYRATVVDEADYKKHEVGSTFQGGRVIDGLGDSTDEGEQHILITRFAVEQ